MVPVRVDSHNGVVLETSFQEGVRREALRSLAQLANSSELPLQVGLLSSFPYSVIVQRRSSLPAAGRLLTAFDRVCRLPSWTRGKRPRLRQRLRPRRWCRLAEAPLRCHVNLG